jgi:hypothetical protein
MSCVEEQNATATAAAAVVQGAVIGIAPGKPHHGSQQQELRQQHPAAPPPQPIVEEGQRQTVHQGSPEELEGVGRADQCKQADGGQVDIDGAHPVESTEPVSRNGAPLEKPIRRMMSCFLLR